jgi:rhodanese-related sulfurtransferase
MGVAWSQEPTVTFMKVAEVQRLIERGTLVLFVDVRSEPEYLDRHIKGAISVPLQTLSERLRDIPRGRLVMLY